MRRSVTALIVVAAGATAVAAYRRRRNRLAITDAELYELAKGLVDCDVPPTEQEQHDQHESLNITLAASADRTDH